MTQTAMPSGAGPSAAPAPPELPIGRSRGSSAGSSAAGVSAYGAVAVWCATLSWSDFVAEPSRFLVPLLIGAFAIVTVGVLLRRLGVARWVVWAAQVVVGFAATSWQLVGTPLPIGDTGRRLLIDFGDAWTSSVTYAPPVPESVPGVEPILIAGGIGCVLLMELLAGTLDRAPLSGVTLIVIFSVPLTVLGDGPPWYAFGGAALAFVALLTTHQDGRVDRWGRSLTRPQGRGVVAPVMTNRAHTQARIVGLVATTLALLAPMALPTLSLNVLGFGPGSGEGGNIGLENPVADMRRDLLRGADRDLVTLRTDDPDPSYLRVAVLNRFSGDQWSTGDRTVPTSQRASGDLPPLIDVDSDVPRTTYSYDAVASETFESTWLPTGQLVSSIQAPGDWRYDVTTRDFLASAKGLTTAGLSWSFDAVELELDADRLVDADSGSGLVDAEMSEVPGDLPPVVRELAVAVSSRGESRFEKAVALQTWFRGGGGFTYDISRSRGNGTDDLVRFLSNGPGGRTGYCEQFATAMALMARTLGIPARVAVGFLRAVESEPGTWTFSSHDLHAWPELFFPGAGWVRFEPTPSARVARVPDYTTETIIEVPDPTVAPSESGQAPNQVPTRDPVSRPSEPVDSTAGPDLGADNAEKSDPWPLVALGLGVLMLFGMLVPRTLRQRRRGRRLAGSVEEVWLELAATTTDLGLRWPDQRSPHETGTVLESMFGTPPDEFTPERPLRGPEVNPEATRALARIVEGLEIGRYAERDPSGPGTWTQDGSRCVDALIGGANSRARRRAEWFPRSLWRRSAAGLRTATYNDTGSMLAVDGAAERID